MITIIDNQPIRLRNSDSIDVSCDCLGQTYCQPINKNDATQFQVKSSNLVSNGDFTEDLTGWDISEAIIVTIVSIENSSLLVCDGEITISATGGTPAYTYSIDGGAFGGSATFAGLCTGEHFITVKDSLGNEGSLSFELVENIDCSLFSGSDTDDLLPYTTGQLLNCNTDDFI